MVDPHIDEGAPGQSHRATPNSSRSSPKSDGLNVLVIGYGSSLRSDDGLGPLVAERLRSAFPDEPVTIISTHQLTFDFAEIISRARCVILIDATAGDTPGTIAWQQIQPEGNQSHSMLHHMEPGALLASTQALYGTVPHAYLWTVAAESFAFGDSLSPAVKRALPGFLAQLTAFIQKQTHLEL